MRYALASTVPPSVEPVTLGEAKDHLKVDPDLTEDDVLIEALIVGARQLAESQTNRKLITQTWVVSYDTDDGWWGCAGFSSFSQFSSLARQIEIPLSPVQAVLGVTYYDAANVLTTLDPLTYETDLAAVRARLRLVYGEFWPTMDTRLNGLGITIRAGYGDTADSVPRAIRLWMLMAIAAMYENRSLLDERLAPLVRNQFLDGLLDPYRIVEI